MCTHFSRKKKCSTKYLSNKRKEENNNRFSNSQNYVYQHQSTTFLFLFFQSAKNLIYKTKRKKKTNKSRRLKELKSFENLFCALFQTFPRYHIDSALLLETETKAHTTHTKQKTAMNIEQTECVYLLPFKMKQFFSVSSV